MLIGAGNAWGLMPIELNENRMVLRLYHADEISYFLDRVLLHAVGFDA